MRIILSPGQAVTIHGWMAPKETLTWNDVIGNERLTVKFLTGTAKVSKELLHKVQPDLMAWLKAGRVTLPETHELLGVWTAHPIKDLKADFADIVALKWGAQTMRMAGVTYQDLRESGMTNDTMGLFALTLYDWSTLGFSRSDAEAIPAAHLCRTFGMQKADVIRCLKGSSL